MSKQDYLDRTSGSAAKRLPRVGLVAMAFPGFYLGEEKASGKLGEASALLHGTDLEPVEIEEVVTDIPGAKAAGRELAGEGIDCICVLLTTFVPDHFIVALLDSCDLPLFLWAVEREIDCISLVGGMLINPTLYDLGKQYRLAAGDLEDPEVLETLMVFARASMIRQVLREMRVGYMGKNPVIMFSMAADEYGLKKVLGVDVAPLRDFEYSQRMEQVPDQSAEKDWAEVQQQVGRAEVSDTDGLAASKSFLAMMQLVREMDLDALSLNCWTQLKSKICLPLARMNDLGVGAGCEGDLHTTILMRLLFVLAGRSAINGDFMRLFPDSNQILFSHCGAGPFSLARSKADIELLPSIETRDGIGVFFPADQPGTVTALNLMGSREGYRLSVLTGEVQPTDLAVYQGNPMQIRFEKPVGEILQAAVDHGAGHHWSIAYGSYVEEFRQLASFLDLEFHLLS
jgi:L-fucose isomerase-like protein